MQLEQGDHARLPGEIRLWRFVREGRASRFARLINIDAVY